jgi:hypothetical protein
MFEDFKFRIRKFLPCQAIGLANALVVYLLVVSFFFLSAGDIAEQIVEGFSFPLLAKAFLLLFLVSLSYSFTILSMLTKLNEKSIRNINYRLVLKGTLVNFLVFLTTCSGVYLHYILLKSKPFSSSSHRNLFSCCVFIRLYIFFTTSLLFS